MKTKWLLLGIGAAVVVAILAPRAKPVVVRRFRKVREFIQERHDDALVARMEDDLRQGRVH